jgi:hypothetical protein
VVFSLDAARSTLAGFERLNRKVSSLFYSYSPPFDLKKGKKLWVTSPILSGYDQHTSLFQPYTTYFLERRDMSGF